MRKHLDAWREDRRARDDCSPAAEIRIIVRDGSAGFPEAAPFDRILVSAGVQPGRIGVGFREETLLAQLNVGGILIYPETLGSLHRTRKSGSSLIRDEWEGVAFVPLRGRNA
jgi:protein-L-isoaspartate(D-aspartate) O-methyltransferase